MRGIEPLPIVIEKTHSCSIGLYHHRCSAMLTIMTKRAEDGAGIHDHSHDTRAKEMLNFCNLPLPCFAVRRMSSAIFQCPDFVCRAGLDSAPSLGRKRGCSLAHL